MNRPKIQDQAREFEEAIKQSDRQQYRLRLYVTGVTSKSQRAVAAIKGLCEEHLKGRYELEVVDIYQQPGLAKGEQIIAVPTLIKRLPLPLRKFIGNLATRLLLTSSPSLRVRV